MTSTAKVFLLSVLAGIVSIIALVTWIAFTGSAGAQGPGADLAPDLTNGPLPGHDVLIGAEGGASGVNIAPRTGHVVRDTPDATNDARSHAGTVPNTPK